MYTGVATVNINDKIINTALKVPVDYFKKNLPSVNDEMRRVLGNKLPKLIKDEISMVSNKLIFHVYLNLV